MPSRGNKIERFRSRRLEARAKIQAARPDGSPPGMVPSGIPDPWLSLNPWEGRTAFDCPIWEVRLVSGLHLAAIVSCNNHRFETISMHDNRSASVKREMEGKVTKDTVTEVEGPKERPDEMKKREVEQEPEGEEEEQDPEQDSEQTAEAIEDRPVQPLVGEEAHYFQESCIKILVFVTADIENEDLADLIRISKAAGRKLTSNFDFGPRNTVAGFAVLTSTEQQLGDITKRSRRSDYPASGTFTAPFKGKTIEEIYNHFLSLVRAVDGVPAMFGVHALVVLDEQTAEDRDTCLLVSDNDGRLESRRAEFEVALFHLVCLEALMLGLGQCGDRDEQVLTAEMAGREQYEHEERRRREREQFEYEEGRQREAASEKGSVDDESEEEEMEMEGNDTGIASRGRKRKKTM